MSLQGRKANEKSCFLLAYINNISPQTGFFVKETNFSLQGFGFSSNTFLVDACLIFRPPTANFRSVFEFLLIQRKFDSLQLSRFATVSCVPPVTNRSLAVRVLSPLALPLLLALARVQPHHESKKGMSHAIFVAFIFRPIELFQKAGCAEARSAHVREGN